MTTKIEITITENDNVYFIYLYKEKTLINKFQVDKEHASIKGSKFVEAVCSVISNSVTRIIQSLLKGG